jgi:hypothetical protein
VSVQPLITKHTTAIERRTDPASNEQVLFDGYRAHLLDCGVVFADDITMSCAEAVETKSGIHSDFALEIAKSVVDDSRDAIENHRRLKDFVMWQRTHENTDWAISSAYTRDTKYASFTHNPLQANQREIEFEMSYMRIDMTKKFLQIIMMAEGWERPWLELAESQLPGAGFSSPLTIRQLDEVHQIAGEVSMATTSRSGNADRIIKESKQYMKRYVSDSSSSEEAAATKCLAIGRIIRPYAVPREARFYASTMLTTFGLIEVPSWQSALDTEFAPITPKKS